VAAGDDEPIGWRSYAAARAENSFRNESCSLALVLGSDPVADPDADSAMWRCDSELGR